MIYQEHWKVSKLRFVAIKRNSIRSNYHFKKAKNHLGNNNLGENN